MQVTKEQIDNDIRLTEASLEQAKAQINGMIGALTVLKNISEHLGKADPEPEPVPEISEVNADIQAALEQSYGDYINSEEV